MAFTPKLLLGGGVLGGVSVGLGIGELTSGADKVKTPSRRPITQECRFHELIGIAKGELSLLLKMKLGTGWNRRMVILDPLKPLV